MKSLKFLAAFLILLSGSALKSQTDLLKDPEVIWLAETTVLFNPDMNRTELKANGMSGNTQSLKTQSVPYSGKDIYWYDNHSLSEKLFSMTFRPKENQIVYFDSLLSRPMSQREIQKTCYKVDTVFTFDPVTFQEKVSIMVNEIKPNDTKSYKLRMLVYYHRKDMIYRSLPLALAPIGKNGAPMFWIPIQLTDKTDLQNPDITWVKRVAYQFPLSGSSIATIKKQEKDCIINFFLPDVKKSGTELFNVITFMGSEAMSRAEVLKIGNSTDTIISFDPKTFSEFKSVVKFELKPGDIEEIRLVQDWIWDEKTQQLKCRPLGFAPIMNRYDHNGNFLNSGPMFYRREKGVE